MVAICFCLAISACASVKVQSPAERSFEKSREYDLNYEATWQRAVDWFANHNVIIEKIEKPSGLLTAKYSLLTSQSFLDCGEINTSGTLGDADITRIGSLNVTVRNVTDTRTRVNVNFFGEFELNARDGWDGRLIVHRGQCVSTGQLEANILEFIE